MLAAVKMLLAPGSLSLLTLAVAAGALAFWRGGRLRRGARVWIAAWMAAYFLFSLPIVARQVMYAGLVSEPALQRPEHVAGREAVVLLSGSARRYRLGAEPVAVMDAATTLRVLEAARVYRMLGSPLVIVSGAGHRGERSPEVHAMREGLLAAGVPADRVVQDVASRDTHQSALAIRDLLRSRQMSGAVLVTSAHHIPRAMRAFRRAGVDVVASPAPVLPGETRLTWWALVPDAGALGLSEACLHEYAGLVYYRLRGWN